MSIVLTRIRDTIQVFRQSSANVDSPLTTDANTADAIYSEHELRRAKPVGHRGRANKSRVETPAQVVMQVLVSLLVLCAALYVLLSDKYNRDLQKWASGVIGVVLGYWLS